MDKTEIAVGVFNKLASTYQEKFMDVSAYHDTFDVFCEHIKKQQADVLELACGPGNITRYLLHKRADLKILGTDLAPNMIELAKVNNPTANFQLMDCRDLKQLHQTYDAIMCGFCLPYLSKEDAIQLIGDAYALLNPDGVFYISTMEDDYHQSGLRKGSTGDEIFMHYHQQDYLSEAFHINGFQVIYVHRQDYPEKDGTKTVDLIMIGIKH
ncbi:MAG: class I SAM-dependent methyltransferase [Bacteroidetes bacterium]|nr:class I SAM-dependent methyltransferase [Bacteroidota bacterium]